MVLFPYINGQFDIKVGEVNQSMYFCKMWKIIAGPATLAGSNYYSQLAICLLRRPKYGTEPTIKIIAPAMHWWTR